MSDVGFVRLYRSLLGHHAFRNDAEAMAFAWMVMRAAWRPTRVRYKERMIDIDRGQLAVSIRDMAAAMDRDKAWVERLWKRLKSETMIETLTVGGVSLITIYKYNEFQSPADTIKASRETLSKTGARQGQDTEQRREEGKKEEREERTPPPPIDAELPTPAATAPKPSRTINDKPKEARAHEIAPGWSPRLFDVGTKSRAVTAGWDDDEAALQLERFTAHHRSKGSQFKDWQGAWSTWVLNGTKFGRTRNGSRSANSNGNSPRGNRGEGDGFDRALDRIDDHHARQRAGYAGRPA